MDCLLCRSLEQAYEVERGEYVEARSSASFRVCTELAAQKNVELERARAELEEHRLICVSAVRTLALLPKSHATASSRRLVA